jgi:benzil reductase ((S)-benzoin forming)
MKSNTPTIWITGVSSGIGLAVATHFLRLNYSVVGIGRKNSLSHPLYSFYPLDLSHAETVNQFNFPAIKEGDVLICNAGVIGEIGPACESSAASIDQVFAVNTISAIKLANQFASLISSGIILFISSGAGQRPIKGWSAYCASKAAIDMYAKVMHEEMIHFKKGIQIKSIAPGVVDSPMQERIRQADALKFPDSLHFRQLHDNHELDKPELTAAKLFWLLTHLEQFPDVLCSLRDVNLPD